MSKVGSRLRNILEQSVSHMGTMVITQVGEHF